MASNEESGSRSGIDRRTILKGMGTSALALPLAGCSGGNGGGGGGGGGGSTGGTGKPTLNMWLGYYTESKRKRQYTDKVVSKFEEKTGATINITGVPYADMVTKFRTARAGGNLPDMVEVMTNPGVIAGGGARNIKDTFKSMKLSDVVSQSVMNPHYIWGKQATGNDGALVTVPLGVRPYLVAWRQDWLKQAGIPKERVNYKAGQLHYYDDLANDIYPKLQQTKLGQKKGYFPDATGMKQSDCEYVSNYIAQFGGSITGVVSEDGTEATINSKEAVKAFKMQKEFINKKYFDTNSISMGDEEATTKHWAGKIAANHLQDSADLWADYLDNTPKRMKNGGYAFGLPYTGGADAGLTWLQAMAFVDGQFKDQKKLDTAAQFVDFFAADQQRAVENAKVLGFVPAFPDAIKKEPWFGKTELRKNYWRGAALKSLEEVTPSTIPAVPSNHSIAYATPRKMYQRIMQQGMPVKKAADMAAEEINSLLGKAGQSKKDADNR